MPAYRFFNPAPVFFDLLGLAPISGGFLHFYEIGTTTPLDTWSDDDLGTLNANPAPLDSAGRANTNIFLDGSYTVVCKNAGGETIWTRDVIPGGGAGQTIPALMDGQFLTNDGTNLVWAEVRQMPDPTGSTGQYLVTDGAGYVLTNIPTPPTPVDPEIVITTTPNKTFRAGISTDPTKWLNQYGTASAPATGTKSTSVAVTFPTEFGEVWWADCCLTISAATPSGALVDHSITGLSTTGFTANFNVSDDDDNSSWKISNAINFMWKAEGTIEVEPAP